MISREFKLYLNAGVGVAPVINANQFDQDEEWIFTLLQSDGTVYTPSTGAIIGLKSDGTTILNAGTVNSSGQVVITETEQMTAVPGSNIFEILIDGNTHGTANFVVFVERRPGDIDHPSESDISLFQEAIEAAGNVTQFQADISALQSGLATTNANLTSEANTRASADATLQSNISAEASTRQTQDAVLQAEIDQIIAPTGEAPSAAEVQNARIGVDGTTYDTLGNAIRGQVSDLKNALASVNDSIQSLDNGIIFNNADSTMSRLGLDLNIKGNILTINGTYVASARRRFSLKDLTKEGTSVASDWYATALSKLESGKKYTVNIREIDGTVTAPEGATGQIYNLQSYSTSGSIGLNAYKYPDRIASPLFISSGSDFSTLVITINKDMVFNNYRIMITITENTANSEVYISKANGSDDNSGSSIAPLKTIGKALSLGYRQLRINPDIYNEKIVLTGGKLEILPWNTDETFSYDSPYRAKIEFINGTKLTPTASETANIYQASYTAQSESNIYKVFVDHSVTPTTQGALSLEYNAMLIGDKPNTAKGNNKQRLYTPVLTETELSEQGTFWYGNNTIKFHPWDNVLDDAYYVPSDDADTIVDLNDMDSVIMEDVRIVGAYQNCAYIKKSNNVKITACEFGLCGKGMGLRLDNTNAEVYDCHAFGCAVDGFNLHEYGYSLFYGCTGFYCGDDGISHHQGCTGIIDGGEWAFNGRGSGNGAGIAPTFGSQIETRNVYSHDNHLGIMQEGRSGNRRPIRWSDNVVVDNDTDLYIQYYDVTAWNCIYKTKNVLNYGTFKEINNTVLS